LVAFHSGDTSAKIEKTERQNAGGLKLRSMRIQVRSRLSLVAWTKAQMVRCGKWRSEITASGIAHLRCFLFLSTS
jgi:hypothetical protein